jgi:hypothetical protein
MINGGRQLSRDGTSRMNREVHVRFCEGLGVKFPGPTRQFQTCVEAIVGWQRSTSGAGPITSRDQPISRASVL